ncbi:antiterminator Q family protein [Escherichia coli]
MNSFKSKIFRPQCCDDDAMIICGCMARLKKNNSDLRPIY